MLLLLPLGALASCPAGIKLSNVPISTALPFCVKWDSSSLGGCEVACPGVCVELPGADSKGPIETTGGECKLGGGGDGGGEDGGGTGGDGVLPGFPSKNPVQVGGAYQEMTTLALSHINDTLRVGITNLSEKGASVAAYSHDLNMKMDELLNTAKAANNGLIGVEEATRQQTDLMWQTKDTLQQLTNCVVNPEGNNCEHLGGGSGGSDSKIYDELSQFHQDMFGPNFAEYNQGANMYGKLSSMGYDIQSMSGRIHEMASDVHNLYTYALPDLRNNSIEMNRNVRDIAEAVKNGGVGGGSGNGGEGSGMDYSKMPGAAGNPLQVAGAEYKSNLCQDGANCAFDLGQINKQYDESKEALKSAYKGIKTEVADIFKFQLSGSGSVPKCFEMYSLFGKSYSVCPAVGAYWESLAAIMMFIFYFIAFMIIARR